VFISWVGLRGAVPIFLAIIPVLAGAKGNGLVFGTAFIAVLLSLLIQGWTVAPLARRLRLDMPADAPAIRSGIELPDTVAGSGSILGYRIAEGSPAIGHALAELPLPAGNDVLLLVRDGTAHGKELSAPLAPQDYLLLWGKEEDVAVLDSILGPRPDRTGANPS